MSSGIFLRLCFNSLAKPILRPIPSWFLVRDLNASNVFQCMLPEAMKALGTVLIGIIALHLQCSGSCLAESLRSFDNQPPCHKHANLPSSDHRSSPETNNPCDQGTILQSKVRISSRSAIPQLMAVVPLLPHLVVLHIPFFDKFDPHNASLVRLAPIPPPVLRI